MKERPILFNGEMVRAILDGSKTQTRRMVKPQPEPIPEDVWKDKRIPADRQYWWPCNKAGQMVEVRDMAGMAPLGIVGDRLWVRETFCYNARPEEGGPLYWYAATDEEPEACNDYGATRYRNNGRPASPWTPSIHMPREASRIELEITAVRVERLQDITEEDARAEGVTLRGVTRYEGECRDAFRHLWMSVYGDPSWRSNPWVWVYTFRRAK